MSLRVAGHSPREFLPIVVSVWPLNLDNEGGGVNPLWLSSHEKQKGSPLILVNISQDILAWRQLPYDGLLP
jgi:hypothetical protein